ncbi:MAG: tetratricopeptide repeat protein [Methanoregula sp.]|jgi:tetratricopeptide (TPR) repeat protein|uniref:tetratricopeptide repeat protein n=1 Tax=Methanoregula sp. TaxID=2052170 RepID=UPI003D10C2EE
MKKSYKFGIWLFFVIIFAGFVYEIFVNVLGNIISASLSEDGIKNINDFFSLLIVNWIYTLFIFLLIICIAFFLWVKIRTNEFSQFCEFYQASEYIKPVDFQIQKFKSTYILRKSDINLENFLKNEQWVLIAGKPKLGKTRAAYESIKRMKKFSVIKPRPKDIDIEKLLLPPLSNRNIILFFDDLDHFIDKNIDEIINRIKYQSKKIIVVATCRTGKELDLIKEKNLPLYREFELIFPEAISINDCNFLVNEIKKDDSLFSWKLELFDGTPGSVTLDLEDMKQRYHNSGDGKYILKSLKLLWDGQIYLYEEFYVKEICKIIFESPPDLSRRHVWDQITNNLIENGFITKDEDFIYTYSSYLDFCIDDYKPTQSDLEKLKEIFISLKDFENLRFLGNGFLNKNHFFKAIDCYEQALSLQPNFAGIRHQLGYLFTKLGENEETKGYFDNAVIYYQNASSQYKKAIEINSNFAQDYNGLGYVQTHIGEIYKNKGKFAEAKELFKEAEDNHRVAILLNPNYSPAHHSLGYLLSTQGKYAESVEEFQKAIELNPESPFSHNLLGHLFNKLGRFDEAQIEYTKAIKLKPDYPSAHNNLGYLLMTLGQNEEAKNEFELAIAAYPDYAVAYANLGHLFNALKKFDESQNVLKKALEINPDYAEARIALGYALMNQGNFESAKQEYEKAIMINPNLEGAYTTLGYVLSIQGKHEEQIGNMNNAKNIFENAEKKYKTCLSINPNNEDALHGLGIILERLHKDGDAEDCYRKLLLLKPSDNKVKTTYNLFLYSRAKRLLTTGELGNADQVVDKMIKIDPNSPIANKILGILREKQGDIAKTEIEKISFYKSAEEKLRMAVEGHRRSPSTRRHYANILSKLNKNDEAQIEYEKVKRIAQNYPKNNRDYGFFLIKCKRYTEARAELQVALKLFKMNKNEDEVKKIYELLNKIS